MSITAAHVNNTTDEWTDSFQQSIIMFVFNVCIRFKVMSTVPFSENGLRWRFPVLGRRHQPAYITFIIIVKKSLEEMNGVRVMALQLQRGLIIIFWFDSPILLVDDLNSSSSGKADLNHPSTKRCFYDGCSCDALMPRMSSSPPSIM